MGGNDSKEKVINSYSQCLDQFELLKLPNPLFLYFIQDLSVKELNSLFTVCKACYYVLSFKRNNIIPQYKYLEGKWDQKQKHVLMKTLNLPRYSHLKSFIWKNSEISEILLNILPSLSKCTEMINFELENFGTFHSLNDSLFLKLGETLQNFDKLESLRVHLNGPIDRGNSNILSALENISDVLISMNDEKNLRNSMENSKKTIIQFRGFLTKSFVQSLSKFDLHELEITQGRCESNPYISIIDNLSIKSYSIQRITIMLIGGFFLPDSKIAKMNNSLPHIKSLVIGLQSIQSLSLFSEFKNLTSFKVSFVDKCKDPKVNSKKIYEAFLPHSSNPTYFPSLKLFGLMFSNIYYIDDQTLSKLKSIGIECELQTHGLNFDEDDRYIENVDDEEKIMKQHIFKYQNIQYQQYQHIPGIRFK